jgi:hypothetical protein
MAFDSEKVAVSLSSFYGTENRKKGNQGQANNAGITSDFML